jgi:hypothetical protein
MPTLPAFFRRLAPLAAALASLLLGLVFFSSGMAKLYAGHRFPGFIGPVWLEDVLAEHGLGLLGRFIAWAQALTGWLLLTQRFRALGAVMLMPMLLGILLVTVSLHWRGTPYVVAVLLAADLFLLWADRRLMLPLLTGRPAAFPAPEPPLSLAGHLWWAGAAALALGSVQVSDAAVQAAWGMAAAGLAAAYASRRIDRAAARRRQGLVQSPKTP